MPPIKKTIDPSTAYRSGARRNISILCGAIALLALAESTVRAQEDPGDDSDAPDLAVDSGGDTLVDHFHGEFAERVPIRVPAYHGLEPHLALTYHSNDGNGFAGM